MERVKIYAKTVEDEAVKQIEKMSECEAYGDSIIRVMPDCHAGAGCTIGTVINLGDRIVPNTVGVDIGCGMLVIELGNIDVDLEQLDDVIHERVPSGFNIHEKPKGYTHLIDSMFCKDVIDRDMALRSIGTLGGGNHFIELDVDDAGRKYLVIHSGSRNLGKRVCEYWQKKAIGYCQKKEYDEKAIIERLKAEGRQKEISSAISEAKVKAKAIDKDLAYIEGFDANHYMYDMQISQHYATLNRNTMANIISEAMGWKPTGTFTTIHNYIDVSHGILRKGAVSALRGEKLIIPMNMRDGSLICIGKGNIDWLYSAPHGAGRLMSRRKAFEALDVSQFEEEMKDVYSTSVCKETLDESPMAYKPMQEIIDCIGPTVQIVNVIKPLYNFKAKETRKF